MSTDPIGDGLAEILAADAREERAIADLFRRGFVAAFNGGDGEHPSDVAAGWARLSRAIDERKAVARHRLRIVSVAALVGLVIVCWVRGGLSSVWARLFGGGK